MVPWICYFFHSNHKVHSAHMALTHHWFAFVSCLKQGSEICPMQRSEIMQRSMQLCKGLCNYANLHSPLHYAKIMQRSMPLCKGLRFAPTPNWSQSVENAEWLNVQQHIRTEWTAVLGEKNDGGFCVAKKIENSQIFETRKWQN